MRDRAYEWKLAWRHERMGFGRTTDVIAQTYVEAIQRGRDTLALHYASRDDLDQFELVELRRGSLR